MQALGFLVQGLGFIVVVIVLKVLRGDYVGALQVYKENAGCFVNNNFNQLPYTGLCRVILGCRRCKMWGSGSRILGRVPPPRTGVL